MTQTFFNLLLMLFVTNGAPVIATYLFQSHGNQPLDRGTLLADGQPLLGPSKTWRGLAAALFSACALSLLLGYTIAFGFTFGLLVMTGDLASSFIKRRRAMAPSARATGLDQLPESFIPALYAVMVLERDWWWAVLLSLAFMLLEMAISKPLYRLHIRNRPH